MAGPGGGVAIIGSAVGSGGRVAVGVGVTVLVGEQANRTNRMDST
jgi:hypothetical protein